jgi:hypothetical protein
MCEQVKKQFNIWWKLTPVAAVLTVAGWLGWMFIKTLSPAWWPWLLICIWLCLFCPNMYLSAFSLWHWKTRYRGRWPFAWAVAFVIWWAYLPSLVYFLSYVLPELRGKDAYSKPPEAYPQISQLPPKYTYLKSTCFVVGLFLVVFGLVSATVTLIAHFAIWNVFEESLPAQIGKPFTESMSNALWCGSQAGKVTVATSFICAVGAGIGAILLVVSQRIRWRLLEEQEKERDFNN